MAYGVFYLKRLSLESYLKHLKWYYTKGIKSEFNFCEQVIYLYKLTRLYFSLYQTIQTETFTTSFSVVSAYIN